MLGVTEIDERVQAGDGLEHDVAALAAVAAVGTTIFDELFAPKADGAGTTRAGTDEDLGLIEKMHPPPLRGLHAFVIPCGFGAEQRRQRQFPGTGARQA